MGVVTWPRRITNSKEPSRFGDGSVQLWLPADRGWAGKPVAALDCGGLDVIALATTAQSCAFRFTSSSERAEKWDFAGSPIGRGYERISERCWNRDPRTALAGLCDRPHRILIPSRRNCRPIPRGFRRMRQSIRRRRRGLVAPNRCRRSRLRQCVREALEWLQFSASWYWPCLHWRRSRRGRIRANSSGPTRNKRNAVRLVTRTSARHA